MATYLNLPGPAGGYYISPYFLFSTFEQVFRTYPVRTSGSTRISLVLVCPCARHAGRHKQRHQPVSRRSLSPDGLLGRWSRYGVEKCCLTLSAMASHVFLGLAARLRHLSFPLVNRSGMCVGNQPLRLATVCAFALGTSKYTHNTLLQLGTWPWQANGQTARRHCSKPTVFLLPVQIATPRFSAVMVHFFFET